MSRKRLQRRVSRKNRQAAIGAPEQLESRRLLTNGSIEGFVFVDTNNDGVFDAGEAPIPGVLISLTGSVESGNAVTRRYLTQNDGSYIFDSLEAGTYEVSEVQPQGITDGRESDTDDALRLDDQFLNIQVETDSIIEALNFGEGILATRYVSSAWLLASSGNQDLARDVMAEMAEDAGDDAVAQAIRDGEEEVDFELDLKPIGGADSFSTGQNATLTVNAANGVLGNDSDPEGEDLTAALVTNAGNGTVNLSADGSFTYVPNNAFTGSDTFTYEASDGTLVSDPITVSIDVGESNTFNIGESAAAGTTAGFVNGPDNLGDDVVFAFPSDQSTLLDIVPTDQLSESTNAPVVMVEYLDFACPACKNFHENVIPSFSDNLRENVVIVTRHLPIVNGGLSSRPAAIAAEAAGRQGRFDEMSDQLFAEQYNEDENPDGWSNKTGAELSDLLEGYARNIGLNITQFNQDIADPDIAAKVDNDQQAVETLRPGSGTPTVFVNGEFDGTANSNTAALISNLEQQVTEVDDLFLLDRRTGEVTLREAGALDFASNPTITLQVEVRNGTATETVNVTINVQEQ